MLLVKVQAACPVHIDLGTPKIIDGHDNPAHQGLQFPSARVVSETPDCPQKQRRSGHVKEAYQADQQGQVGIEHVLGAADRMMSSQTCGNEIDGEERLKKQ